MGGDEGARRVDPGELSMNGRGKRVGAGCEYGKMALCGGGSVMQALPTDPMSPLSSASGEVSRAARLDPNCHKLFPFMTCCCHIHRVPFRSSSHVRLRIPNITSGHSPLRLPDSGTRPVSDPRFPTMSQSLPNAPSLFGDPSVVRPFPRLPLFPSSPPPFPDHC